MKEITCQAESPEEGCQGGGHIKYTFHYQNGKRPKGGGSKDRRMGCWVVKRTDNNLSTAVKNTDIFYGNRGSLPSVKKCYWGESNPPVGCSKTAA